ncbi:methionyl-tRNA formyltransferase [bacterium]|nr:methionyl-tRNA formyltransferase [bacterium]
MKVVILGKGEMLSNLIEGVIAAGSEIVGVFRYEYTMDDKFLPIKDFFKPSNDLTLIKQYKLHQIKCKSVNSNEFKNELLRLNADVMLVGTWGERIKKEIFDIPVIASVNVHPSLLPKYRGPNPYLQNILHRETKSGITFHLINEDFDRGAILVQKQIDILPNDTSKELKERTVFQARLMCAELLKKLEYGVVTPIAQKEEEATYFPNIDDNDKMLDFERETAEEIHARIRALHPWLPTYYTYKDKFFIPNPYKLKIINADKGKVGEIIDTDYKNCSITVQCKDSKALKMDGVKLYGFFNRPFTKLFIKNISPSSVLRTPSPTQGRRV